MKKSLLLLPALLLAASCTKQQPTFNYNVDKFYDLEVLRYKVPDFESLTVQQKSLLYYLSSSVR